MTKMDIRPKHLTGHGQFGLMLVIDTNLKAAVPAFSSLPVSPKQLAGSLSMEPLFSFLIRGYLTAR
jgi:hypothetical protein